MTHNGRMVVLSGASRGLGLALAEQFVRHGWQVAGCGTNAEALAAATQRLEHWTELRPSEKSTPSASIPPNALLKFTRSARPTDGEMPATFMANALGHSARLQLVDVRDAAQVQEWADSLPALPELVIANAGVIHAPAKAWQLAPHELERNMGVNFYGVVNMARAFIPVLAARGGTFVAMSSSWGRSGAAGMAGYCASKFAVEGYMDSLAQDAPAGVKVYPLDPGGGIDTDMLRVSWPEGAQRSPSPESWATQAYPFLVKKIGQFPSGTPVTVGMTR